MTVSGGETNYNKTDNDDPWRMSIREKLWAHVSIQMDDDGPHVMVPRVGVKGRSDLDTCRKMFSFLVRQKKQQLKMR